MIKTCCIKECFSVIEAKSMCNTHYTRLRLFGDPTYSHPKFHMKSKSPEYLAWSNMRQRCFNKRKPEYKDYGGRGITVCDRWLDFKKFFQDMGEKPSSEYTLDRIDVDGNYEPGNVRWATRSVQRENVRPQSNTGVKNVYKVVGYNSFTVSKGGRYYGSRKTLVEAIKLKEKLE